jgi:hypothetical protein
MPDFNDQETPQFSKGWLDGFKNRHNLKRFKQHGESRSAPALDNYQDEVIRLQRIIREYSSDNIYNADETGLFWAATPTWTIATKAQKGIKEVKARITILPCVNASGTDRLPLWVIGKSKSPRAFGRNNIRIQSLPITYHANKTAWMTGEIFTQWLSWFDSRMRGRKVLLLLDNFSAHQRAVSEALDRNSLINTRVEWLPANTTSLIQPLDQGIINNLKVYYRKQLVEFYINEVHFDRDPLASINIHTAILWLIDAYQRGIKDTTIANCWLKTGLFGTFFGPYK